MTTWAVARSISRPVRERLHWLHESQSAARVLAVFERACDLITHDGDVVALVTPQIGDGPLNVVVNGAAGLFARVDPGAPVTLEGERLWVGGLGVDLGRAVVWEPRPNWDALRARRAAITSRLPLLRALCLRRAPAGSLLALLEAAPPSGESRKPCFSGAIPTEAGPPPGVLDVLPMAQEAAESLRPGWGGDLERLQEGAAGLAGLGSGLTPAGDDFLTGAMLWAWLAHPAPGPLCHALVEVAAPRTTTLSAAFLRATARGECSAPWHALLAALTLPPASGGTGGVAETEIKAAVQDILAHGATSGADSLAGFLYLSWRTCDTQSATGQDVLERVRGKLERRESLSAVSAIQRGR